MAFQSELTTREIGTIFAEEIAASGGKVSDTFDDGTRLFMRAILPAEREVQARDALQGGVAIRATQDEISVHPYVFRQVCKNGAIIAHAIQTRQFELADFPPDPEAELAGALREAVRACCAPEVFEDAAVEMRSALRSPVDFALTMMPMISRLPPEIAAEILTDIMERFSESRGKSRFDMMNAVTSVARDSSDPEVRWRLEEIGGAIPAAVHAPERKRAHLVPV